MFQKKGRINMKNILVTGAAGFIGSNFAEFMINKHPDYNIVVFDKLTYAGNMDNLKKVQDKITFVQGDICDLEKVTETFEKYNIDSVVHFAAESHVDNSIKTPFIFTQTNVIGTHTLLEVAKRVWGEGSPNKFVHISTDEVYGTLGEEGYFTEKSPIQPNSPYSASKAGSDLIALAYHETFKMNVSVTNCSNNYGPYQHNEKLIPHMIKLALNDEKLPVYGEGLNIRDWLYVEDHCEAIDLVLHNGKAGERYNIGGHNEKRNIEIVKLILKHLNKPESLITYVEDRKGHDYRYAIDPTKIKNELGWEPKTKFEDGIVKTIDWYLENKDWLK
jgi:dTDP-glucose 4,6-dehydratase